MNKYTIFSLSLLTIIFLSGITNATSTSSTLLEPEAIEEISLIKAWANQQSWEELIEGCKSKQEGARQVFIQGFVTRGGCIPFAVHIWDIFGISAEDRRKEGILQQLLEGCNEDEIYFVAKYGGEDLLPNESDVIYQNLTSRDPTHPKVMLGLSHYFRKRSGFGTDKVKSLTYLIKAFGTGDLVAWSEMMWSYYTNGHGFYNPYNAALAFSLAEDLVKKGEFPAAHMVLTSLPSSDYTFKHHKSLAEMGYLSHQYMLGKMYWEGLLELPISQTWSKTIGRKWLELAAKNGSEDAHKMLAQIKGSATLNPSPQSAVDPEIIRQPIGVVGVTSFPAQTLQNSPTNGPFPLPQNPYFPISSLNSGSSSGSQFPTASQYMLQGPITPSSGYEGIGAEVSRIRTTSSIEELRNKIDSTFQEQKEALAKRPETSNMQNIPVQRSLGPGIRLRLRPLEDQSSHMDKEDDNQSRDDDMSEDNDPSDDDES
jgi:hypothetical protein